MIEKLRDLVNLMIYGGSLSFNSGENVILDSVYNALPNEEKTIFASQRQAVKLVQRQNPGRLVMAYYRKGANIAKLPYSGYEHCLADVKYKHPNGIKKTSVVLHDGVLQSLERAVPRSHEEVSSILSVTLHPKGYTSVADEIDAEEHGNNA